MNRIALRMIALAIAASTTLVSAPVRAEERNPGGARAVDISEPLKPGGTVVFRGISGSLAVSTWDKAEVRVTGTIDDGVRVVQHAAQHDTVRIIVDVIENSRDADARLEIKIPKGSHVDADVVSAPITVNGELGRVKLEVVSGNISVDGSATEIACAAVNGDLRIGAQASRMQLNTVSGAVIARASRGELEGKTVSGATTIAGGPFDRVRISTVSGVIELSGALSGAGPFSLVSQSGDIRLTLPEKQQARFQLMSFSGKITNAFTSNDDGAPIQASSFSGNIIVKSGA